MRQTLQTWVAGILLGVVYLLSTLSVWDTADAALCRWRTRGLDPGCCQPKVVLGPKTPVPPPAPPAEDPPAPHVEPPVIEAPSLTFQVYRDVKKEWRWRLVAANNKIIADSGEGYHNQQDCWHALELVRSSNTRAFPGYKLVP